MTDDKIQELKMVAARVQRIMNSEDNDNNAFNIVLRNNLQVMVDLVLEIEKDSIKLSFS